MANEASRMPAAGDITFYDVGRSIALWVSAFEILVHPGRGWSGLSQVYELLDGVEWRLRETGHRVHLAYHPNPKKRSRRALGAWLYGELYRARNDFLHGNPVSPRRLTIRGSGQNLFRYAAPLYRMALTAFLKLTWSKPFPALSDPRKFGRVAAERSEFLGFQKSVEKGLLSARRSHRDSPVPLSARRRAAAATTNVP
jgi:hypothetical protein